MVSSPWRSDWDISVLAPNWELHSLVHKAPIDFCNTYITILTFVRAIDEKTITTPLVWKLHFALRWICHGTRGDTDPDYFPYNL